VALMLSNQLKVALGQKRLGTTGLHRCTGKQQSSIMLFGTIKMPLQLLESGDAWLEI